MRLKPLVTAIAYQTLLAIALPIPGHLICTTPIVANCLLFTFICLKLRFLSFALRPTLKLLSFHFPNGSYLCLDLILVVPLYCRLQITAFMPAFVFTPSHRVSDLTCKFIIYWTLFHSYLNFFFFLSFWHSHSYFMTTCRESCAFTKGDISHT